MKDEPWVMRTYSGHSSATASNLLYKSNLAKGQTGLSIAFDLPTQLGYDPDSKEALGEVGRVGVPIAHIGHMAQLLDGIPLETMNTSMTINATAPWLLGLYIAYGQNNRLSADQLQGTTQNDIVKEYLSRGTYIFPPLPSLRLIVDMIAFCVKNTPRWNPINICSYHLQEAGATPVQEVAYSLATAIGVLDAIGSSPQISKEELPLVVGRISFFVNSGIRFIEETCKMRAFVDLWDRICRERYKVDDPKFRRFRYGVQVNSLGLTEEQPENNIARIVLQTLGVTLSKSARARAMQLPCWNEALGLPRPWDQQWSLRIQQILAYETDLLEYQDIFDGSRAISEKTSQLTQAAWEELQDILDQGGAFIAIDELKRRLVQSQKERTLRIESGELKVVGVNCFRQTVPSPLEEGLDPSQIVLRPKAEVEVALAKEMKLWRKNRDQKAVYEALANLSKAAKKAENIMPATIALAHAKGTTGEWAQTLRDIFGEYTAPTGISSTLRIGLGKDNSLQANSTKSSLSTKREDAKSKVKSLAASGNPPRLLLGKPGLDGHSNGAEQIAIAARDSGFEVIYQGIRLTPEQIVQTAIEEDPDIIGLSILSGSHLELVPQIIKGLHSGGINIPVVVGGIIPSDDQKQLKDLGVAAIYTPKDFSIGDIICDLADLIKKQREKKP
ncbi:MAG: protein meaA [Actinobacteria bacterium]|nr:protein meaA [Actinomycetota bacterium]MCL6105599.1 protein meaA [Actinomycetota bacterium]